jgi:hypothetical protein
MQHEATHKLRTFKPVQAFAASVIGTHHKRHFFGGDGANALIADGRAMRVTAQVLQHLGRTSQRGFGIHHPVMLVKLLLPLAPIKLCALRVTLNLVAGVGGWRLLTMSSR